MEYVALSALLLAMRNGTTAQQNTDGRGFPVSRIETIRTGAIDPERVRHVELDEASCQKWRLQKGDILFSHINSVEHIGKTAIFSGVPENLIHGMNLMLLRPDQKRVIPEFLGFFLNTHEVRSHFQAICKKAVNQASLNQKDIGALRVPLPPVAEQRRIVDILNHAASIRRLRDEARAKVRELVPALFVEMFGDPATNPKEWEVKNLSEAVSFTSGATPSKKEPRFWGSGTPWVSAKDMKADPIVSSEDSVTDAALTDTTLKLIPANSVLLVVRGMILAHTVPIRVNAVPVAINQDLKALQPLAGGHHQYFRWCLQCLHPYLLSKVSNAAHGTTKLDMEILNNLKIPLPPFPLQQQFADRVAEIEATAALSGKAAAAAEQLAQSLLSQVFGQRKAEPVEPCAA
ncbi:restriction endonuclease subunit S [Azospirillum sp. sgz301742]